MNETINTLFKAFTFDEHWIHELFLYFRITAHIIGTGKKIFRNYFYYYFIKYIYYYLITKTLI